MNALARLVALGSFPVVFLAAGCTSQGEGDRCTPPLNSDCQADFICLSISQGVGVCCPANRPSSVPLCNPGLVDGGSGGTAGAAGAAGASGAGGESEAGSDAVTEEAATTSTADAPAEGAIDP
jgi:hypothetical protein